MNPLVGIQGPGLMGGPLTAQPQMPSSLMNYQPGQWSQVAYKMAGSPNQGPYPSVAAPPMPAGINASSGGGGSSIGGTALGLLSVLAKNPSLVKSAYNGVSGLLGGGAAAPAATAYGTDAAVAPASSLTSELPATATGTYGTSAAPSAAGGLMGAGSAAPIAGSIPLAAGAGSVGSTAAALGAGAPGVFASGSAAAGSGGAAAGGASLGAAGTAAAVAAPFIAQQLGLMIGDAWTAKNTQGNAALKGWMQSTGSTYKPTAGNTNVGQSTFGSQGQFSAASNPGTMYGPNGQPMTPTQVVNAIAAWAKQNGVNPGDFHPV